MQESRGKSWQVVESRGKSCKVVENHEKSRKIGEIWSWKGVHSARVLCGIYQIDLCWGLVVGPAPDPKLSPRLVPSAPDTNLRSADLRFGNPRILWKLVLAGGSSPKYLGSFAILLLLGQLARPFMQSRVTRNSDLQNAWKRQVLLSRIPCPYCQFLLESACP